MDKETANFYGQALIVAYGSLERAANLLTDHEDADVRTALLDRSLRYKRAGHLIMQTGELPNLEVL